MIHRRNIWKVNKAMEGAISQTIGISKLFPTCCGIFVPLHAETFSGICWYKHITPQRYLFEPLSVTSKVYLKSIFIFCYFAIEKVELL